MSPSVLLVLLFVFFSTAQPPPDYDDGGPPWRRRPRPPWARGGWRGGLDGPPPPWRRPPWRRPPFGPPPPWRRPPPMGPPPGDWLPLPGDEEELGPPIPPPVTEPPLEFTRIIWEPRLRNVVSSIDANSAAFSRPGQSYAKVVTILDSFYKRHTTASLDLNKVTLVEAAGTELGPNRHVAGALFEIDMVLTVAQATRIAATRRARMLLSKAAQKWPTTITYKFGETDTEWRARILQALQAFQNNTCLRFTENDSPTGDYMYFARGEGCMSSLGRLGGGQLVSIGYGCEQLGIVAHELGHTLGFWHEHSRPDRDSYLTWGKGRKTLYPTHYRVNAVNMQRGAEGQFVKRSAADSDTQGLPFDYASMMHYAANSYSKSMTDLTLSPKDSLYRSTIGSRSEPSYLDYKHVNKLYCSSSCPSLPCQNGGYVDPNDCSVCKCPLGLGGRLCDRVQQSVCGMELTASPQWRNISFSGSSTCYWRVRAPSPSQHVEFELTHVWFTCAPSCNEYVELKWHDDLSLAGGRLCCKPEGGIRVSESATLVVIAKPRKSSQFTLRYKIQTTTTKVPRETDWESTTSPSPDSIEVSASAAPLPIASPSLSIPSLTAEWTEWSEWGECTERCGACGQRMRARACTGGKCQGDNEEKQQCNLEACQVGVTRTGRRRRREGGRRSKREWCCQGSSLTQYGVCRPDL